MTRGRSNLCRLGAIIVALVGVVFAFDATARPAPEVKQLFSDLGDTDAAVRERARVQLMGSSRDDLVILREVVADATPLAPAQIIALRDIVMHVFLASEPYEADRRRGFLGIKMDADQVIVQIVNEEGNPRPEAGVIISECLPGFCAFRYLLPGDVILGAAGDPLLRTRTQFELKALISSRSAGDTVTLDVLRRGHRIAVTVVLDGVPREIVDQMDVEPFLGPRQLAAEHYWKQHFAPLLGEGMS